MLFSQPLEYAADFALWTTMQKLVRCLPFGALTIHTSSKKGKVKNGRVRK